MLFDECRACAAAGGRFACAAPGGEVFAVVGDESVGLWAGGGARRVGVFEAIERQVERDGHFARAAWVSDACLACVTTVGSVKVFAVDGERISQRVVLRSGARVTAVCGFDGYLFCGTEEGEVVVMSMEVGESVRHRVCEFAVKEVRVCRRRGVVVTAAGEVLVFKVEDCLYSVPDSMKVRAVGVQGRGVCLGRSGVVGVVGNDGGVYVMGSDGAVRKVEVGREIRCIAFSMDEEYVVVSGPGYIATVSVFAGDVVVREDGSLHNCVSLMCTASDVFVLCSNRLFAFPVVRVSSECLFSGSVIWEMQVLTNGLVQAARYETNRTVEQFIGKIVSVAANDDCVVAVGSKSVSILDRRCGRWAMLEVKHGILHVALSGSCMFLVVDLGIGRGYGLSKMVQNGTKYEQVEFIRLESEVTAINGDGDGIALCLGTTLVFMKNESLSRTKREYSLPEVPVKVSYVAGQSIVIAMLSNYSLTVTYLKNERTKIIHTDCKNFFVDRHLNIVYIINRQNLLLFSPLEDIANVQELTTLDSRFIPVQAAANLGCLVLVDPFLNGSLSRFNPVLFANSNWDKNLEPVSTYSNFTVLVTKIINFMLECGMKVDKRMFSLLGSRFSDVFSYLTDSKKVDFEGIVCFEIENGKKVVNCYQLLDYIRVDEGITIALTASLLLFEVLATNEPVCRECLKFLEPILVKNVVTQGNAVTAAGVTFRDTEYASLKKYSSMVVSRVVVSLMRDGLFERALSVSRGARQSMEESLVGTDDSDLSMPFVLSCIAKRRESGDLSQNDITELIAELRSTSWTKCLIAFMFLSPLRDQGVALLSHHESIRKEILNSEWRDVIDI